MTNATARERRGAGAHGVSLQDDDAADAKPGQIVGGAHAHDSGADDDDLGRFRHESIPPNAALIRGAVTGSRRAAAAPTAAATALATAAPTPDVPASPAPLTPKGFVGVGASSIRSSTTGVRSAVGIA